MIRLLVVAFLDLRWKSFLLCKGFVGVLGLGVCLLILLCLWGGNVIFQRKLCLKVLKFCLSVGVWSACLVGLQGLGVCLRIMR